MNPMLAKILLQVGLMLLIRRINSNEDTTKIEEEIAAAGMEEIEEIARTEGMKMVGELVGDRTITGIITDLTLARDVDSVKATVNIPENKLGILQVLTDMISSIFKAVFGG